MKLTRRGGCGVGAGLGIKGFRKNWKEEFIENKLKKLHDQTLTFGKKGDNYTRIRDDMMWKELAKLLDHLFLHCRVSSQLWALVFSHVKVLLVVAMTDIMALF